MRQRRVTGIEERIAPYADLILQGDYSSSEVFFNHPAGAGTKNTFYYPRWYQRPSPEYVLPEGFSRTYVELGCGRGRFINALAAADPEGLYIGAEGCRTIVIRALEKTRAGGLSNVRYIDSFINDITTAFAEESLDGLFLNFSDPWPKERHAERRLTSPSKASNYFQTIKSGGVVVFKTDGEAFYDYSRAAFLSAGFIITEQDAKGIAARAAETPTEYEIKFRSEGKPVYSFTAAKA